MKICAQSTQAQKMRRIYILNNKGGWGKTIPNPPTVHTEYWIYLNVWRKVCAMFLTSQYFNRMCGVHQIQSELLHIRRIFTKFSLCSHFSISLFLFIGVFSFAPFCFCSNDVSHVFHLLQWWNLHSKIICVLERREKTKRTNERTKEKFA